MLWRQPGTALSLTMRGGGTMRYLSLVVLVVICTALGLQGCPEQYQPQEQSQDDQIQRYDGPLEERTATGTPLGIGHN